MALRDQPYLPLYVQDFLTDEKLIECSAQATGVYIRIMCILHKSEDYGCILLKQKDKQNENNVKNFALKLVKQMPYDLQTIEDSLNELIDEKVLTLENDKLYQKRMIKDGILSNKRAEAGKKGIESKQNKNKNNSKKKKVADDFAIANHQANSENEIVVVIEDEINNKELNILKEYENNIGTLSPIISEKLIQLEEDYGSLKIKKAIEISVLNGVRKLNYIEGILKSWGDKTWDEILEEEQNFKKNKNQNEIKADWLDKDIQKEEMSEEELKEMEELLSKYRK